MRKAEGGLGSREQRIQRSDARKKPHCQGMKTITQTKHLDPKKNQLDYMKDLSALFCIDTFLQCDSVWYLTMWCSTLLKLSMID